ncbi:MAG: winged helix-turn-helix transcriptional regulator [Bacteroidetes bacterium]|nr:winged helix-turn-helix transcriptional regulator [Bacteroidota bacterium]
MQFDNPFRPLPNRVEAQNLGGKYHLGTINPFGDFAGLQPEDFTKGVIFSGATGFGKTYPYLLILDQILQTTPEERGFSVLVIQRFKRDADRFSIKNNSFHCLEWDDLRWNMWDVDFSWDTPIQHLRHAILVFSTENFLFTLSQPILKGALEECYTQNGIFKGHSNPPTFSQIRKSIINFCKTKSLTGSDMHNTSNKLIARTIAFEDMQETVNCKQSLPVSFFLENDICLNLEGVDEFCCRTIVNHIITTIHRYLTLNSQEDKPLRLLLIIDEARWLFDIKRDNSDLGGNQIIEVFMTTCREAKIGKLIITQEPESVSKFLLANSSYRLGFPVFGESINAMQRLYNLSDEQVQYLPKLAPYGEGIFCHPNFDRPVLLNVPGILDLGPHISTQSIIKYNRPFVEKTHRWLDNIQKEREKNLALNITSIKQQAQKSIKEQTVKLHGVNILSIISKNPFYSFNQLREQLKLSSSLFSDAVNWLENKELIEIQKIRSSSRGKIPKYLVLTQTGQNALKIREKDRMSPSHFKHTFYEYRVQKHLESEGHKAFREWGLQPDNIEAATNERIDVFAIQNDKPIAYEITLTLDKSILSNIKKCLDIFKVTNIVLVCENDSAVNKAKQIVNNALSNEFITNHIIFTKISTFL